MANDPENRLAKDEPIGDFDRAYIRGLIGGLDASAPAIDVERLIRSRDFQLLVVDGIRLLTQDPKYTEEILRETLRRLLVGHRRGLLDSSTSRSENFLYWTATSIANRIWQRDHPDQKTAETIVALTESPQPPEGNNSFDVLFDSELSGAQVARTLEALADYFRACGGTGLTIEPESVEFVVREQLSLV